jgi:hypothetical protein
MIDEKQQKNVEYFNYPGSMIANDTECNLEIKSRMTMAKAAVNKRALITSKLKLSIMNKPAKCQI